MKLWYVIYTCKSMYLIQSGINDLNDPYLECHKIFHLHFGQRLEMTSSLFSNEISEQFVMH